MSEIGKVIDGKYEILKQIGRGGMSVVYLAMDNRLNKQWAIKEIKRVTNDKNNEIVVQSLMIEANMMKKLEHPYLPRIVDIVADDDVIRVVMDYIEGESLENVIKKNGAQSQENVIEWAKEIADVLNYLHTRTPPIIYRDIKPGNIMLRDDGTIRLIDFGIAREYKEHNMADTVNLGTKGYAAPEQFGGKGQTDARTDIYCLGATMYHLVTGKSPCDPPYEIYPIRQWNPSLSAGLEKIILKCTKNDPSQRYQSCAELIYALNNYDKVDDKYRKIQKGKLVRFIVSISLSVFFLIMGVTGSFLYNKTMNDNFEYVYSSAKNTGYDYDKRLSYYEQAIEIRPGECKVYEDVLQLMCENDNIFTDDESKVFLKYFNGNRSELEKNGDKYYDLCYNLGKTFWYHYNYKSGESNSGINMQNMQKAMSYFQIVSDDKSTYSNKKQQELAKMYYDIASVYNEINNEIATGGENLSGKYNELWNDIKGIIDSLSNMKEAEKNNNDIKIELCRIVCSIISNYASSMVSDGIEISDMENVLESQHKAVNNITDSLTDDLKNKREYTNDQYNKAVNLLTRLKEKSGDNNG